MKVPSSSNVIAIANGKNHQTGKAAKTGLSHEDDQKGDNSSQITVLFPRTKAGHAWQKTQKSQTERDSGSDQKSKTTDVATGLDLFGSLFAGVEQKFSKQNAAAGSGDDLGSVDDASAPQSSAANTDQQSTGTLSQFASQPIDFSLAFLTKALNVGQVSGGKTTEKAVDQPDDQASSNATEITAAVRLADVPTTDIATKIATAKHVTAKDAGANRTTDALSKTLPTATAPNSSELVSSQITGVTTSPILASVQAAEAPKDGNLLKSTLAGQAKTETALKSRDQGSAGGTKSEAIEPNSPQNTETAGPEGKATPSQNAEDSGSGEQPDLSKGAKATIPANVAVDKNATANVAEVAFAQDSGGKVLTPVAQIVENIKNAVPVQKTDQPLTNGAPQAVKTLEIQLQPEGLGTVTVTLKSDQGKMKVQISAKLETTRQELERNSAELVNSLQKVDATFKDADVNFSNQNQGSSQDPKGQNFGNGNGNGNERRATPEYSPGSSSNGGQDASQSNTQSRNPAPGNSRLLKDPVAGEAASGLDRTDGIYL